ncbi:MAG TPA: MFS transporter [Casimicrobiaceae bacterium]|nr:MFS transporter [Casimicrobiaceae bacterium]
MAAAAALLAVVQGFRASLGLFVSPINTATGLGLAAVSFALATSQLASGVAQPLAGRLGERFGTARLIIGGALASALSIALVPALGSAAGLVVGFAVVAVAGTALGSAPVLVAAVLQRVPPQHRGRAAGIVGAGGSAGQLLLGPGAQAGIAHVGWTATLYGFAGLALAAGVLAGCFRRPGTGREDDPAPDEATQRALHAERMAALRDRSFWCLAAGFFVCGFHVSFLLAHMPGFIATCGLPASLSGAWLAIIGVCNVAGSIVAGLVVERVSPRLTLAVLYALRGAVVLAFAAVPVTTQSVLVFSVAVGVTYMASLAPTTAVVEARFGARNVGVLFGLVMLLHQVGSFLGVWIGGEVLEATGSLAAMWLIDGALAVLAALACLFIRADGKTAWKRFSIVRPRRIVPRLAAS